MKEFQKTVSELMADSRDKTIIDLRKTEEFAKGSCEGAVNLYWEEFDPEHSGADREKPLYLLCYTGETSDEIAEALCRQGWEAYSIVDGFRGYLRWKLSGGK